MKQITNQRLFLFAIILFMSLSASAQNVSLTKNSKTTNTTEMKTYLIEREIPDAGKLTADQLKGISQASCSVLKEMGPDIEWIQSYVTGNKIFCIYKAQNEQLIRDHAKKGGFPANNIIQIANIISPETAK